MSGLPRSGKTTWIQEHAAERYGEHVVVSPDDIRLALHGERFLPLAEGFVWTIARTMALALFQRVDTVIVDATNTTTARRAEWKPVADQVARSFDHVEVRVVHVCTDVGVCVNRALADFDVDLVPVIRRMDEARGGADLTDAPSTEREPWIDTVAWVAG